PGIYLQNLDIYTKFADNNTVDRNIVNTLGNRSHGIALLNALKNNLTGNIITTTATSSYGAYLNQSYSNFFISNTINATATNDVFLYLSGGNNTLINTTFNKSDIGFNSATDTSSIAVKYYLDVTVRDENNVLMNTTNVSIYNVSNIIVFNATNITNGTITQQVLTEFIQNATLKTYSSPYTINTSKVRYFINSTTINLTTTSSISLTIIMQAENGTPTISTVDVIPDSPQTSTELNCTLSATDPQGDTLSYFYQWYDNGTIISGATNQTYFCTLSGCNRGDNYTCIAIASDGTFNSTSKSAGEIIENTVPTAQDADITPNAPLTTNTLTCGFTYSDADSDSQSGSAYLWYNNSILVSGLTSSTVDAAYTTSDETWFCQATPKDGTDFGTPINSTTEAIGSSAPSISSYSDNSNTTNPTNVNTNVTFSIT
ncbi:hypothetical protein J4206_04900, partial [Candidatus Woesearchaeota archaeon]|nr:hypothetical protein [Candidatus Woesearchaeota archaeon]